MSLLVRPRSLCLQQYHKLGGLCGWSFRSYPGADAIRGCQMKRSQTFHLRIGACLFSQVALVDKVTSLQQFARVPCRFPLICRRRVCRPT